MASAEVYDAIRTYLLSAWTSTPIAFENENVDQNGNEVPPNPAHPWVDVEMTGTLYGQQSIGASVQADNRWDEEGVLFLHVLVESGSGSRTARQHAKALADLFRGKNDLLAGNLEFLDAFLGSGRPGRREGNWFEIPVAIEWRRVEA